MILLRAIPGLFFICYGLFFKKNSTIFQQINVSDPSSIWCWDLNSQSPPITTRPGLQLLLKMVFVIIWGKDFVVFPDPTIMLSRRN